MPPHCWWPEQVVVGDLTGGSIGCIRFTDSGTPKVQLRLHREGVSMEMNLTDEQAAEFAAELEDVRAWVFAGGPHES